MNLSRKQIAVLISICILYIAFGVITIPFAEFLGDDALMTSIVGGIVSGQSFPIYTYGWFHIPHGAVAAYLYAPFGFLFEGFRGPFYGQLAVSTAANLCLILICARVERFWFGVVASLLLFFNPFFSSFSAQTIWPLSPIVLFNTLLLGCSLALYYRWSLAREVFLALATGMAMQCHELAVLTVPPILIFLSASSGFTAHRYFRLTVLLGISAFPQWAAIYRYDPQLFLSALIGLATFLMAIFFSTRSKFTLKKILEGYSILLVVTLICVAVGQWARLSEGLKAFLLSVDSIESYNLARPLPPILTLFARMFGYVERVLILAGIAGALVWKKTVDRPDRLVYLSALILLFTLYEFLVLGTLVQGVPPFSVTYSAIYYPFASVLITNGIFQAGELGGRAAAAVLGTIVVLLHLATSVYAFVWISAHGRPTFNNPLLHEREWILKSLSSEPCIKSVFVLNRKPPRSYPDSWLPFIPNRSKTCSNQCGIYVEGIDGASPSYRNKWEEEGGMGITQMGRVKIFCTTGTVPAEAGMEIP